MEYDLAQKEFDEDSIDETLITDEDIDTALKLDNLEDLDEHKKIKTFTDEDLKQLGVV